MPARENVPEVTEYRPGAQYRICYRARWLGRRRMVLTDRLTYQFKPESPAVPAAPFATPGDAADYLAARCEGGRLDRFIIEPIDATATRMEEPRPCPDEHARAPRNGLPAAR